MIGFFYGVNMTHLELLDQINSIVSEYVYRVDANDKELESVPDLARKARELFDKEEK